MKRQPPAATSDERRRSEQGAGDEQVRFIDHHAGEGVTAIVAAPTSFEIVNAAYGRAAGNRLMQAMTDRIAGALSSFQLSSAREGATFTLAIVGSPARGDAAVSAVERALAEPFPIGAATIHVGARIGVARIAEGEPADHLLRRAADALARARASDGATTRVAGVGEGVPLAALAADLHRAIGRGEIDVLFQPQVSLRDGAITGVEALARWRHPKLGGLGAATLLAAAERADLGVALSDHVQALALSRAAAWPPALSGLRVALNVTAADIAREEFVSRFLGRIVASGIAPARVTAEVTESGVIHDLNAAAMTLSALRNQGVRVALDDFGTGYSNLAYLTRLPLDYLKIDRSLTLAITGDTRERVVVEGVLSIARGLSLETIVEGVETVAQRELLAARGATYYQGFLCAGPLDDAALVALIEGRHA